MQFCNISKLALQQQANKKNDSHNWRAQIHWQTQSTQTLSSEQYNAHAQRSTCNASNYISNIFFKLYFSAAAAFAVRARQERDKTPQQQHHTNINAPQARSHAYMCGRTISSENAIKYHCCARFHTCTHSECIRTSPKKLIHINHHSRCAPNSVHAPRHCQSMYS
jgi:hypothetical protein